MVADSRPRVPVTSAFPRLRACPKRS